MYSSKKSQIEQVMNKTYNIIWNHALNRCVVVSEIAKARGKNAVKTKGIVQSAVIAALGLLGADVHAAVCGGDPLIIAGTGVEGPCDIPSQGVIVQNGGLLSAPSGSAALTLTSASTAGGVNNHAGGTIQGDYAGMYIYRGTISGQIENQGLVESNGYGFQATESLLNQGIVNSGNLRAGYTAIELINSTLTGGLENSGTIISGGVDYAIVLMSSSLSGGIVNNGKIGSAPGGILLTNESTMNDGITNNGTITADFNGITIRNVSTVTGGLINHGLISGGTHGVSFTSGSNLSGGLLNTGTISGGGNGINLNSSAISGGISNSGSINGVNTAGIRIAATSVVTGGLKNTGVISGGQYGIYVDSAEISSGITNSGLISGTSNSIYIGPSATVNNIVITGNNTASFSGTVDAQMTNVVVANGATYTLNTTFFVNNFANQGKLIVPSGLQTIQGDFTLEHGGTFSPTIVSPTQYAQVVVSGVVQAFGELAINASSIREFQTGSVLTGVLSGASLVPSFDTYSDTSYLYDFVPIYSGAEVGLQVVRSQTIANAVNTAGNAAGQGAAGALDAVSAINGTMTTVTAAFGQMSSYSQINNAVSQTLPVFSGATVWNTMSVLSSINSIIEARHLQAKGISNGDDPLGNSTLWMKPFGNWTNQANNNGAYGFRGATGGVIFGSDTNVGNDARVGASFAWGNTSAQSNAGVAPQSQTSNIYQFVGYGSYALTDRLEANFMANGGWNNNSSNRQIGFMGTSAQASYNSAVWHVGAGLRQPFDVGLNTQLIPSVRYDYNSVYNQGYSETGADYGLGLNVNSQSYQMSILGANAKVVHQLSDHNSVNANLGVNYNFSPTQTYVAAAFQGSPGFVFTTNGINPQAVMGQAGVGYTYRVNQAVDVGIRYDLSFQSGYTNQMATAKARWMF